jgi:hypothetical protein
MLNTKKMNYALQLALVLSLTAKSKYSDVHDRNYMEPISQNEEVKEDDQEKVDQIPLGIQVDLVVNKEDHKSPASHQESSGHGNAGTKADISSSLIQEPGNDDTEEPQTVTYALQSVAPK